MTRRFRIVFTFVATLAIFAVGGRADACSCLLRSACPTDLRGQIVFVATAHVETIAPEPLMPMPADDPIMTWHDDFHLSVDVTVVGRQPSIESSARERTTLRVQRAVRGPVRQQYQIVGESFGASCDYQFKDGEEYLVYGGYDAAGDFWTSICTLTKPL